MAARIVIVVEGGIVQGVWSDVKDLEVAIYDHDNVEGDPECKPDEWATTVVEETPPASSWFTEEKEMGKLYAPNGAEIIGTYERIPGVAIVQDVALNKDGTFHLEYEGETKVWWDGQEIERDEATGECYYVDADSSLWRESQLTYRETENAQA